MHPKVIMGKTDIKDNSHQTLHLSEEAWFEIFLQLPASDLFQFKSICKSWHDLITSPFFSECHLRRWKGHRGLSFVLHSRFLDDIEFFHLSHYGDNYVMDKLCHDYPPETSLNDDNILDSRDGLLLIKTRFSKPDENGLLYQEKLLMCNPVTRSYRLLPIPPLPSRQDQWLSQNTGHIVYDDYVRRYKIVWRYGKSEEYYIFDMETNSSECEIKSKWRRITSSQEFNREGERHFRGFAAANVFFEGKLYWLMVIIGDPEDKLMLLTLDVVTEKFHRVYCPRIPFLKRINWPLQFSGSNGKFYHVEFSSPYEFRLTSLEGLNDHRPTWVKRRLCVNASPTPILLLERWSNIAHVFEEDDNVIFITRSGDAFSMYDMISGKITSISLANYKECSCAVVYVSSLVSWAGR
ncbi:hypothetical protein SAY87_006843 [Trapa incisa]|uniref:F-box domain-containing protein n=1 Tax=Trapa incisa TaxID=236973 RepID=A0AAN7JZB5_9MYRT|nr:hypothetical protein SAY87_006843 [Trapa incisa]